MTAFDRMHATLMDNPDIGVAGWWLPRAGVATAVRLIVRVPALGELADRAPSSLPQRLADLSAPLLVAAGDLLAWGNSTWLLGGQADPDSLGITARWICTAFTGSPAYDGAGCPQLSWNGTAWIAAS